MAEGFLLIDSKMNTVLIPYKNRELRKWMDKVDETKIHKHKTFKELGSEVKMFLQNTGG